MRNEMRLRWAIVAALSLSCACASNESSPVSAPNPKAAATASYALESCEIDAALEPQTHRIEAVADLTIALCPPGASGPAVLLLDLHPALGIDKISCEGKPVSFRSVERAAATTTPTSQAAPEEDRSRRQYAVSWAPPRTGRGTLRVHYGGVLFQDVSAGEIAGEIHNRVMLAHIGPGGVFLSDSGGWYPDLVSKDDEPHLTTFDLSVADVPGMLLAASGNPMHDGEEEGGGRSRWHTPFPLEGMALVGGPHTTFTRQAGDVVVRANLSERNASQADSLLAAAAHYLDLYQPFIGPYPFTEFTIVDNFFSSGFAFPGFTVLDSRVIAMGPRGLEPGYLDHELLHNWWGNGVFVSPRDGNWCESLTSYCTNYMRLVLEDDAAAARAYRRNVCYGMSLLPAERDVPLDQFGRADDVDRLIGYKKGAMVFAMLADRVGQPTMWRALRRLASERMGRPTTWDDIRGAIELESDQTLQGFFARWVRDSGMPNVIVEDAGYDVEAQRLMLTVSQKGRRVFDLLVPIRMHFDGHAVDKTIHVTRRSQLVFVEIPSPPTTIELDPDYRVLRRIPAADVMPTISGIEPGRPLLLVRNEADFEAYKPLADVIQRRFESDDQLSVTWRDGSIVSADDFKQVHALVLGSACLAPIAKVMLRESPLRIEDGYFEVGGKQYDKPTDEVLCCVRNPSDPGAVICYYYGNDASKLQKARVAPFYGNNSLVVFEDGRPTYREDFERTSRVVVQILSP